MGSGSSFRDLAHIDRLIHEPNRLILLALLYPLEAADFTFLQRESGLTKGNLSAHLGKLEQADYLVVQKGFHGRVPRTTYSMTEKGRNAYKSYLASMKRVMTEI